jgi:YVTN family beta-propeller protein
VNKIISLSEPPSGLVLSADGKRLFVTCVSSESEVFVFDTATWKLVKRYSAGHTALSPVLSSDGKILFVCNQFDNDVSLIDVKTGKTLQRIAVRREPIAAALSKDGRYLLVANHLPSGRADVENVAAVVSVIDVTERRVVKELALPSGGVQLKDIRVSPDGKYAAIPHIHASYQRAATQVVAGWINANALTLLDLEKLEVRSTFLLDQPQSGAANPWGVAWSVDGKQLAVAHAGTHEVSLIDFEILRANLPALDRRERGYKSTNRIFTTISH